MNSESTIAQFDERTQTTSLSCCATKEVGG